MLSLCYICTAGIQTYRGESKHTGQHPHIWGCPNIWDIQTYRGIKHMWGVQTWGDMGTPLIQQSMLSLCCVCTGGIQTSSKHRGASKHMQGIQTYGGVQTYRGYSCMSSYPVKWVLPLVYINFSSNSNIYSSLVI